MNGGVLSYGGSLQLYDLRQLGLRNPISWRGVEIYASWLMENEKDINTYSHRMLNREEDLLIEATSQLRGTKRITRIPRPSLGG